MAKDLNIQKGSIVQRGTRGAVRAMHEGRGIRFVLSTERIARDGHSIAADAWRLGNFRANPVALWAHKDEELPIGSWSDLKVEQMPEGDDALFGTLDFASAEYEFAGTVEKLYRSGAMNAVSVRWSPYTWEPLNDGSGGLLFTDVDLLEVSAVPVPADPDAIMLAAQRGIVTPDELTKFQTRLGVPTEIIILGSENVNMEDENSRIVPAAIAAQNAGKGAKPSEDAAPVVAPSDPASESDGTVAGPAGDLAASDPAIGGADVSETTGDPDPVEGEELDPGYYGERAGKKISKKRGESIGQAVDAIRFALDTLTDLLAEAADPEGDDDDMLESEFAEDERAAHAEDLTREAAVAIEEEVEAKVEGACDTCGHVAEPVAEEAAPEATLEVAPEVEPEVAAEVEPEVEVVDPELEAALAELEELKKLL